MAKDCVIKERTDKVKKGTDDYAFDFDGEFSGNTESTGKHKKGEDDEDGDEDDESEEEPKKKSTKGTDHVKARKDKAEMKESAGDKKKSTTKGSFAKVVKF